MAVQNSHLAADGVQCSGADSPRLPGQVPGCVSSVSEGAGPGRAERHPGHGGQRHRVHLSQGRGPGGL